MSMTDQEAFEEFAKTDCYGIVDYNRMKYVWGLACKWQAAQSQPVPAPISHCDIYRCQHYDKNAEEHCGAPTLESMIAAKCPYESDVHQPKQPPSQPSRERELVEVLRILRDLIIKWGFTVEHTAVWDCREQLKEAVEKIEALSSCDKEEK